MTYECPSCSQKNTRLLGRVAGHNAFVCVSCELAFMEPGDCEVYQHEEWYEWLEFTAQVGRSYLDSAAGVYRKQLQVLEKLVSGRNLVDVGAGIGIFAKIAAEKGWTVSCVELNARARKFGTQLYGLDYRDLEAIAPNSLDVVRLSHVLEHIPRPKPLLSSIYKVLKPGGVCVVLVPNYEPLSCFIRNAILKCIPGPHDFRGHIYAPQHALGFRPQSLSEIFAPIGFFPLKIQSVSQGNSTYYPWKSDGVALTARHVTYELLNMLGNQLGRGSWVVGYFRAQN